jgi:putative oxidoreductase
VNKAEIGIFISRITLGIMFLIHGLMKYQGGIDNTIGFFEMLGIPGYLAYPVGILEIIGGVCVIIGLGTRIFAAIFCVIMLTAIVTAKFAMGFAGGYEFELALFVMSLHLLLAGSRFLALDRVFSNQAAPDTTTA